MNIDTFHKLAKDEQYNLIRYEDWLSYRSEGFYRIELYCIEEVYIEVFYHKESNSCLWINASRDRKILELYLDNLYIPDTLPGLYDQYI